VDVLEQPQPRVLDDVRGVALAQPVAERDGPQQRHVATHDRVPRLLVAVRGRPDQAGDLLVMARRPGGRALSHLEHVPLPISTLHADPRRTRATLGLRTADLVRRLRELGG
jgi:hypothetical protein